MLLWAQHNRPSSVNRQVCVDFRRLSTLRSVSPTYWKGWGAGPAISSTRILSEWAEDDDVPPNMWALWGSRGGELPSCWSCPSPVIRHNWDLAPCSFRANTTLVVPGGTSRTNCWLSTSNGSNGPSETLQLRAKTDKSVCYQHTSTVNSVAKRTWNSLFECSSECYVNEIFICEISPSPQHIHVIRCCGSSRSHQGNTGSLCWLIPRIRHGKMRSYWPLQTFNLNTTLEGINNYNWSETLDVAWQ